MRRTARRAVWLLLLGLGTAVTGAAERGTIGAVEKVGRLVARLTLRAWVDTGATLSSADARDTHVVEVGGVQPVRFVLVGDEGKRIPLELEPRDWRG